ncbi:MAG: hypothetical protein C0408_05360 [Odoribacter sp.]|nr:hypothetical protein [Odoribacter sp.]
MRPFYVFVLLVLFSSSLFAQEDLMNLLNQNTVPEINFATATFKSTRIMNGHSIERMPPGQLDFRISHRFGLINSGAYNLWGLDQANIHFSLEYGILKWLMIGAGRGTYEKTFDGFTKFSILRQSAGARVMPVSLSLFTSAALNSLKWSDTSRNNYFSSRLSYTAQVLIARKFSQGFSLQITPTYVHRNLVGTELDPNDLYAAGIGGRIKLTKRISLNAEYYYVINANNKYLSQPVYNPLSVGFDLETGGHVFQIILTNSLAMIEKGFIGETTGQWKHGDIHLGFNISRVFTLKKNK